MDDAGVASAGEKFTIREIEARDIDALYDMMCELADHEGQSTYLTTDKARLRQSGFGNHVQWRGLIAEGEGGPIGFATYTEGFHIWSGSARMRVDDVFVRDTYRSAGIGKKLMEAIFEIVDKTGGFVSWQVQPTNKRAISFYESLGAQYVGTGKCTWRPE